MIITVQLSGVQALSAKIERMQEAARAGLKAGVADAAQLFETEAKLNAPVVTGLLRDSIHTETLIDEPERQQLEVLPDTPYAHRIEFGFIGTDSLGRHYHQAPEPYMRPAFDAKQDDAREAVEAAITEQLGAVMSGRG